MTAVLVISGMLVAQNAIATEITVQASKSAYVGKLQNGDFQKGVEIIKKQILLVRIENSMKKQGM